MPCLRTSPPVLVCVALLMLTIASTQARRQGPRSGVFQAITRVINKEKIKQRIMQGLNLTNSRAKIHGTPRELPTRNNQKIHANPMIPNNQPQTLTVYSTASNSLGRNSFTFTLDSRVRSIAQDIHNAKLVLHLWDARGNKRRGKGKRKNRYRRKLQKISGNVHMASNANAAGGNGTQRLKAVKTPRNFPSASLASHHLVNVSDEDGNLKNTLHKIQRTRSRLRTRKQRRQRKSRVKIVVRLILSGIRAKRRVAVGRVKIHRFGKTSVNLKLPKDILKDAALRADHMFRLQVSCKRCGRHIHLDRVLTTTPSTKDNGDQSKMWINPYRPYIFIQYGVSSSGSKVRRKRQLSTNGLPNEMPVFTHSSGESTVDSCISHRVWVTFEELGLRDLIIYPDGFYTDVCRGACLGKGALTTSTPFTGKFSQYLSSHNVSSSPLLKVQKSKAREEQSDISTPQGTAMPQPGKQFQEAQSSAQREERLAKNDTALQCVPLYNRPLKLVYIQPVSKEIIFTEIQDLIQKSCGCIYKERK